MQRSGLFVLLDQSVYLECCLSLCSVVSHIEAIQSQSSFLACLHKIFLALLVSTYTVPSFKCLELGRQFFVVVSCQEQAMIKLSLSLRSLTSMLVLGCSNTLLTLPPSLSSEPSPLPSLQYQSTGCQLGCFSVLLANLSKQVMSGALENQKESQVSNVLVIM